MSSLKMVIFSCQKTTIECPKCGGPIIALHPVLLEGREMYVYKTPIYKCDECDTVFLSSDSLPSQSREEES